MLPGTLSLKCRVAVVFVSDVDVVDVVDVGLWGNGFPQVESSVQAAWSYLVGVHACAY